MSRNQRILNTFDAQHGSGGDYGAVSVGTSATQVIPASDDRLGFLIQNGSSGTPVYIGFDSNVTAGNGVILPAPNGIYTDETYTGDVYVIAGSSGTDVRYQEITR